MSTRPDAALLQAELTDAGIPGVHVHTFERLDSTSAWLREHARQLIDDSAAAGRQNSPHLCVTDWQSAGVGRRGRQWQTRPGNVTFSLLTRTSRPAGDLMGLSLVTGIAVAEYLAGFPGVLPRLKWPNDVLLGDAKVGGLLTELASAAPSSTGEAETLLFTGIGINLLHDEDIVGYGIGATSLEAVGMDASRQQRDHLVAGLATAVLLAHGRFLEAGWGQFARRWAALDWLVDRQVSVHRDDAVEQAVARGVNEQGALLVERAGEIHPIFSGNVSIRPGV
ncbi:MAG: biotin--[acetyl-CoA-carboxylase] ligase [Granulosicoccus sp.]|nr:biotin--[acetyl-CoA-carboxylase] ligase [Granulosicoccus sp.]